MERHAVRVTPDALRQIRAGHPWVYDRSIRSGPESGATGDLAVVFDDKRRFAAIGLWDPASPLRLRVLHHGRPSPIDADFWAGRIDAAVARREQLFSTSGADGPATTGWRVVHGENDRLPGLVADRYGSCLVAKLDTAALEPHLDLIVPALVSALARVGVASDTLIVRSSRAVGARPRVVRGERPAGPVPFLENGLRLEADVWQGQKTGHFLDQRDNRALVGSLAAGADVLDVFSCTGGFSLNAAAGGARSVVSVDQSDRALATARRHVEANRAAAAGTAHETIRGDAFEVMASLAGQGRRFDVVVVDPPSFASKAADRPGALAAYRRLAQLAAELVRPGGLVFQASCSSRVEVKPFLAAVARGVGRARRQWELDQVTGHAVDHPIGFGHGRYLKGVLGRVR